MDWEIDRLDTLAPFFEFVATIRHAEVVVFLEVKYCEALFNRLGRNCLPKVLDSIMFKAVGQKIANIGKNIQELTTLRKFGNFLWSI